MKADSYRQANLKTNPHRFISLTLSSVEQRLLGCTCDNVSVHIKAV